MEISILSWDPVLGSLSLNHESSSSWVRERSWASVVGLLVRAEECRERRRPHSQEGQDLTPHRASRDAAGTSITGHTLSEGPRTSCLLVARAQCVQWVRPDLDPGCFSHEPLGARQEGATRGPGE